MSARSWALSGAICWAVCLINALTAEEGITKPINWCLVLVAINADPTQVDDMIDTLCNLRGMSTAVSAGAAVN
jgi:hypothetical protein